MRWKTVGTPSTAAVTAAQMGKRETRSEAITKCITSPKDENSLRPGMAFKSELISFFILSVSPANKSTPPVGGGVDALILCTCLFGCIGSVLHFPADTVRTVRADKSDLLGHVRPSEILVQGPYGFRVPT